MACLACSIMCCKQLNRSAGQFRTQIALEYGSKNQNYVLFVLCGYIELFYCTDVCIVIQNHVFMHINAKTVHFFCFLNENNLELNSNIQFINIKRAVELKNSAFADKINLAFSSVDMSCHI